MPQVRFENHIGEKLTATVHAPDRPNGAGLVLGHCFTCSRHTRILMELGETLPGAGLTVLRFDFSGNGGSDGNFEESTYSKQIREIMSAMDYLKNRKVENIFLAGHSMGGMSALFAAAEDHRVKGVAALAVGFRILSPERLLNKDQLAQLAEAGSVRFSSRGRDLTLNRAFFDDAARFDVYAMMGKIACPVLQVHGSRDEIMPVSAARKLHAALSPGSEWFMVEGADHMFSNSGHRRMVTNRVREWITRLKPEA